jgi:hypothetical protein
MFQTHDPGQGCQMVYLQINSQSGKILEGLALEDFCSFMAIWSILWLFDIHILRPFGIFYGHCGKFYGHLVYLRSFGIIYGYLVYFMVIWYTYFMVIWYISSRFGMLQPNKSGNPDCKRQDWSSNLFAKRLERKLKQTND